MYTLAIICYTLGAISLGFAILLMLLGAKPTEIDKSSWAGYLLSNGASGFYDIRILCRYGYLVLLPLACILHYFS